MSNLVNIFGGPFTLPAAEVLDPPEIQLQTTMRNAGIEPPEVIYLDGKIHRFNSGTKGKPGIDKSGWYIGYMDAIPAGRFGDWRAGIELSWRADIGRKLNPAEEMAHARRLAELKAQRDRELEKQHEIASNTVDKIWLECGAANADHPYLKKKGIEPHGARITGDGRLVLPLYDEHGLLTSLQYIDIEGGKLYHPGGATGSKFMIIGSLDEPGTLYIAEGFATAATIHEETNRPCVVAYSASNLVPVTGLMREKYGIGQDIVIVADNDASGVGQRYADQACAKYGARYVIPEVLGDVNDYRLSGGDVSLLLNPSVKDGEWLTPADSFSEQPAPIKWLVKHWLQENALIMVHGPSGGGKTFVVLDWCLHMASSQADWFGHKTKSGNVVYLAGEGHQGLRGRVAAWKHHHQASGLSMWISKTGCDLNTAEGFYRVVNHINSMDIKPSIIVVDTLHRFLSGDENSAQDAKTMLDACNNLMTEFNCSVLLVHHTGVSDDAQHRARGSSAWRGALDIEISIVPGKDSQPIEIIQRKSKDAELAKDLYARLESVNIPGWFDEDGEQVTSAVIVTSDAPERKENKKDSKLTENIKLFTSAWFYTKCDIKYELPYISRSALLNYLMVEKKQSDRTAGESVKPSRTDKLIGSLLLAEIIDSIDNGWIVKDNVLSSALLLRKNEKGNK